MSVPSTGETRKKTFSLNHSRAECRVMPVFIRGIGFPAVIELCEGAGSDGLTSA